ncbi:biopolymer transporter ExbD [Permianibacter sp. IMCC34836]|uniref:ExbD/TolR family protein n=1 Tax=Permianibacter fluminis TaxID=2738515 RepID=UPI00155790FD|nr:biopolymer transporter ExbD [Permianibacter fluminis]NQD38276.1 biopolymer transporter ExbD [Permianibacter fluminis]
MAFSSGDGFDTSDEVMGEINMTPLVDVMLVLLIIFILALPVLTNTLPIHLPDASAAPSEPLPELVQLGVAADGQLYWQNERIAEADLPSRLQQLSQQQPQPPVQIQADRAVAFEHVARVLAAAQKAGVKQLGVLTEPK